MTQRTKTLSVCLPQASADQIRDLAEKRGANVSHVLRELVQIALPFATFLPQCDLVRLAANLEYIQAAIDFQMSHNFPDEAEQLPSLVIKRMAVHHGYQA